MPCSCRLLPVGHAWFRAVVHCYWDVQLVVLASTIHFHMFFFFFFFLGYKGDVHDLTAKRRQRHRTNLICAGTQFACPEGDRLRWTDRLDIVCLGRCSCTTTAAGGHGCRHPGAACRATIGRCHQSVTAADGCGDPELTRLKRRLLRVEKGRLEPSCYSHRNRIHHRTGPLQGCFTERHVTIVLLGAMLISTCVGLHRRLQNPAESAMRGVCQP